MKTRFAYITLSVIAALVLSSCEKNVNPDFVGEPNLFIKLDCQSHPGFKSSDPAYSSEKAINSVRIFFAQAGSDGVPVDDAKVVEVGSKFIKFDKSTSEVEAKVSGLKGNYQLLYVLANCPDGVTLDLTNYDTFTGSCGYVGKTVLDSFWNVSGSNFVMVNSVDQVPEGATAYEGGILVDFSQPAVTASVNLERLAAKIVADQSDFLDFQPYHTKVLGPDADHGYVVSAAAIKEWALLNCVNSFNLVKKYDEADTLVTPSSDPSYPVATKATLTSAGHYYTNPAVNQLVWKAVGDSLYCLENNPSYYPKNIEGRDPAVSVTKMKGRVTAVVFRAQILLADGFDANANIQEPITVDPNPGYWKSSTYQTNVAMTLYKYKGDYYASLDRLVGDNPALEPYKSSVADLRSQNVKVYENGYMYYTYWIADTKYAGLAAPYYSVERNKSYRLTVDYISDFGDDLPCGGAAYDPEDPIDRAIPRINVDLEISKWDSYTADYEIQ